MSRWALDGALWRQFARKGARGPLWFARFAPPVIGIAVAAFAHESRQSIARNLRRVRGRRGALREALDLGKTFATYASCLSEALGAESGAGPGPQAAVVGQSHVDAALAARRGALFVTAHTAGWEIVGALLGRRRGLPVLVVEAAERDEGARAIQDDARQGQGVRVAHVGEDPFSGLALIRHLREGGVLAMQMDRVPRGHRARSVTMFGAPAWVPEGPLRLACLTGAPIVPVFTVRRGYQRYEIVAHPAIWLPRQAEESVLNAAAQTLASGIEAFARAHPTQWFHFRAD